MKQNTKYWILSSLIIHEQKKIGQGFRHPCMSSSDKQPISQVKSQQAHTFMQTTHASEVAIPLC